MPVPEAGIVEIHNVTSTEVDKFEAEGVLRIAQELSYAQTVVTAGKQGKCHLDSPFPCNISHTSR